MVLLTLIFTVVSVLRSLGILFLFRVYLNSFRKNIGQQGSYLPARCCDNSTDKSSSDKTSLFCSNDAEENHSFNAREWFESKLQ